MASNTINISECLNNIETVLKDFFKDNNFFACSIFDGIYGEVNFEDNKYRFLVAPNLINFQQKMLPEPFVVIAPIMYILSEYQYMYDVEEVFKEIYDCNKKHEDISEKLILKFKNIFMEYFLNDFDSNEQEVKENSFNKQVVKGAQSADAISPIELFYNIKMLGSDYVENYDKKTGIHYIINDDRAEITKIDNDKITKNMEIPKVINNYKIIKLGNGLFKNNLNMQKFKIPNSVKFLGDELCMGCKNLRYVYFSPKLKEIGARCFKNCNLQKTIFFPTPLKKIGESAFQNNRRIENISFEKGFRISYKNAFKGCCRMNNISFKEGLIQIEEGVFKGCENILSINLPSSLQLIGDDAIPIHSGIKITCNRKSNAMEWLYSIDALHKNIKLQLTNEDIIEKKPVMRLAIDFFKEEKDI